MIFILRCGFLLLKEPALVERLCIQNLGSQKSLGATVIFPEGPSSFLCLAARAQAHPMGSLTAKRMGGPSLFCCAEHSSVHKLQQA